MQEGGFGIRDLRRQNMCLLLNFIHKLHLLESPPWKQWFMRCSRGDIGDSTSSPSFLQSIVDMGLPTYKSVTRVELGDGYTTSFWQDRWLPGCALCFQFEALFSHSPRPNATVAGVLRDGISLQPRLSAMAAVELEAV